MKERRPKKEAGKFGRTWTDDDLRAVVPHALSGAHAAELMGLSGHTTTVRLIKAKVEILELDISHWVGRSSSPRRWSDDDLRAAVARANNVKETIIELGLVPAGPSFRLVREKIEELGIDTSQWTKSRRTSAVSAEKVRRGIEVATMIRAGVDHRRLVAPEMSEHKLEEFIQNLASAASVSEAEIEVAAHNGGIHGKRKPLTENQQRVIQMLAEGYEREEIAQQLEISKSTVSGHLSAARFALDAKTNEEMIAKATGARLVRPRARAPQPIDRLTRDVLQGVAEGLIHKEIAAKLHISSGTVSDHTDTARVSLGARNASEMIALAVTKGLVEPPALPGYEEKLAIARPAKKWYPTQHGPYTTVERTNDLLTETELQILRLLVDGQTDDMIARSLGKGMETVKTQLKAIYRKLGTSTRVSRSSRVLTAVLVVREGIVE